MRQNNYYRILKVSPDAGGKEIKESYYRLSKKYHPDTSIYENAHEVFVTINEAYQVLSDPKKRSQYDLIFNRYHYNPEDSIPHFRNRYEKVKYYQDRKERIRKQRIKFFKEQIKQYEDFFNASLKADGEPYYYNLHKTVDLRGRDLFKRIRYRYITVPIPRSKKSRVIHRAAFAVKIATMISFIFIPVTNIILLNVLIGSIVGGIIIHPMYYLFKTKPIFYHARKHPLVKYYHKKGFIHGPHAMMSTTLIGLFYYPSKWLF